MARRRIEVEIIGNPRSLQAALGRSVAGLDKFADRMRAVGTQVHSTGRTLTRGITLPVLGVAAASVKMGLDFEKQMTNIRALVGASDKQMQGYREGVLELGRVVPQGPQELAEALYFVTSSGYAGEKALRVLRASAKAAAAGLGDTTMVADAVTSAVNAYGEANLSAGKATDVLLATVREGKAEPEELAQVIGRVIAPAEAMGVTFGEVGGAISGLTLGGLDAAEAVTGLRGVLGTLLKPSEKARDVLEDAGMSIGGIRRQVDKNGLLPTLQSLRDRFGANKDALGALFPNVRALNAFLSLTGRNARKNAKAMKAVEGATGDTGKAFKKAGEDPAIRLQKAWSSLRVSLIELSGSLIPFVTQAVDLLTGLLDAFDNLSPGARRMVIGLALVAAAIGPLLMAVGSLIVLIGVIASPIGVVVIALAALGAALVVLWTRSETFRRIVGQAWIWIQAQAARFVAWFQGTAMPAIQNVLTFLRALWARFGAGITAITRTAFAIVSGVVRAGMNVIRGVVELVLAIIRGDWRAAWEALKTIAVNLVRAVATAITAPLRLIVAAIRGLGPAILGLGGEFLSWGLDLGRRLIDGILSAIRGAAGSIGSALRDAIPSPTSVAKGIIPGLASGARNFGGGLAVVGERGPELVNLPRGSDVYNARRTRGLLAASSPGSLEGMRIAGTLDIETGALEGVVVGKISSVERGRRRRARMGAE